MVNWRNAKDKRKPQQSVTTTEYIHDVNKRSWGFVEISSINLNTAVTVYAKIGAFRVSFPSDRRLNIYSGIREDS